MKKTLISFWMLFVLVPLFAQQFAIDGMVLNVKDSVPVENHPVWFQNMETMEWGETHTNADGYYKIEIPQMPDSAGIHLMTYDLCTGDTLDAWYYNFMSANYFPFYVCADSVEPACQAYFTYYQLLDSSFIEPLPFDTLPGDSNQFMPVTIQFENYSAGENLTYYWTFGDGSSSNEANPVHTYEYAGSFGVELTIVNENCSDTYWQTVFVGDTAGNCYAYFDYSYVAYGDSTAAEPVDSSFYEYNTLQFWDYSSEDAISWYWTFGDGHSSSERNPVHTYDEDGQYWVQLIIATENCENVFERVVYAGSYENPFEDCAAYFYYEPVFDSLPTEDTLLSEVKTYQFIDFSEGEPYAWNWNFGDGTTSTLQNPMHTYAEEGEYVVTLSIESDSCSSSIELPVLVGEYWGGNDTIWEPEECMAMFYTEFLGEQKVAFYNESYGDLVLTRWDFGDGQYSEEENPIHQYDNEGEYLVTLHIETADSCTSYFETLLFVGEQTDSTELTAFFVPEIDGLEVTFHNKSEGNPWNYYWDFGDGASSTVESPKHTYASKDTYIVTLGVSNPSGVRTYTIEMDLKKKKIKGMAGNGATALNDNIETLEGLSVYPMPVGDVATLQFEAQQNGEVTIQLYNLRGQMLYQNAIQANKGVNQHSLSTEQLELGMYILKLQSANGQWSSYKLIK